MRKLLQTLFVFAAGFTAVHAAVIAPTTTYAHNVQGAGGISSLFDNNDHNQPSGRFTKSDPNDPGTWTATSGGWPDDWQGIGPLNKSGGTAGTNDKVGWVLFDFGTTVALDEIFIWNVSESTGQPRRVNTYNIYHATTITTDPVSGNSSQTNGSGSKDYDFSSTGWTQLTGTRSLDQYSDGTAADGIETLGVNARYVGLEFITFGGDSARVGLNEVVFTAVPEPSAAFLGALGVLALLRRRR